MNSIRLFILGVVLTMGLILPCAEATDGSTVKTVIIKLAGVAMLATVPAIAKWAGVSKSKRIARFLDED